MNPLAERIFSAMHTSGALKFGNFTLKSGRSSPYFFNSGDLLSHGTVLAHVAEACADALMPLIQAKRCDYLFGPAYKGIALTAATVTLLAHKHGVDMPWGYNRKEVKTHGEGGQLVGAPLQGAVVVLDDVLTRGTAMRETMELLRTTPATPSALLLLFDRQETHNGSCAATALAQDYSLDVHSLTCFRDLFHWIGQQQQMEHQRKALEIYARTLADGAASA